MDIANIKQNISTNLTELRKRFGYTQSFVGQYVNFSDKAVSKWENGDSVPDLATLAALAKLYGVTVDFLISEHDDKMIGEIAQIEKDKRNSPTQITILLMSLTVVWLIATIVSVIRSCSARKLCGRSSYGRSPPVAGSCSISTVIGTVKAK